MRYSLFRSRKIGAATLLQRQSLGTSGESAYQVIRAPLHSGNVCLTQFQDLLLLRTSEGNYHEIIVDMRLSINFDFREEYGFIRVYYTMLYITVSHVIINESWIK